MTFNILAGLLLTANFTPTRQEMQREGERGRERWREEGKRRQQMRMHLHICKHKHKHNKTVANMQHTNMRTEQDRRQAGGARRTSGDKLEVAKSSWEMLGDAGRNQEQIREAGRG